MFTFDNPQSDSVGIARTKPFHTYESDNRQNYPSPAFAVLLDTHKVTRVPPLYSDRFSPALLGPL